MDTSVKHLYEFGPFLLDPRERLLLQDGEPVPLTPKAFELLVFLVEREGHLIDKAELLREVWHGCVVEEGNLAVIVSVLRKALNDDRGQHRYIETVSKRGYRFVADVKLVGDTPGVMPSRGRSEEAPTIPTENRIPQIIIPEPRSKDRTDVELSAPSLPVRSHASPAEIPVVRNSFRRGPVTVALIATVLILTGLILFFEIHGRRPATRHTQPSAEIKSLAVLPFQILGAQSGDEYLGVGIADSLITRLGNTGKIIVRSTNSIQKYAGAGLSPQAAGAEQGVDAVINGCIQRQAGRVRLTLQLIRVHDGVQLWGDAFDEAYTNIFALEDSLSRRVAQSVNLKLSGEETHRMNKRSTESQGAYEAYVKGRYFWNKRNEKDIARGLEYFRQAIALDPKFAEAYVGVADSYDILAFYAVLPPKEAFPAAKQATQRALELDDGLAEAHASLGFIHFYYDWNGVEATREFQRSLEENPNYATAHSWYSVSLAAKGMFAEAETQARLAMEDDPLSPSVGSNAGWAVSLSGNPDKAIAILKKAIEIDPNFARARLRLGRAYEQKQMYDMAIAELEQAVKISGGEPCYVGSLGHAYAMAGQPERAKQLLHDLESRTRQRYIPSYAIALIYSGLGDNDQAIKWLEKAYEDRSTGMAFLRTDPELSGLHFDPRFEELSRRISF
jgi:DNA-binding winged helix-turn-helix (wHTH) protein/TolB-like protein/Tfp pilus assembly protein PilF